MGVFSLLINTFGSQNEQRTLRACAGLPFTPRAQSGKRSHNALDMHVWDKLTTALVFV
jgi:hypothetical protein